MEEQVDELERPKQKVCKCPYNIFIWHDAYFYLFQGADAVSSFSSDYDNRPCIGMCYYRKLKGITVDKVMMAKRMARKPCIGLCHRERKRMAKLALKEKENEE